MKQESMSLNQKIIAVGFLDLKKTNIGHNPYILVKEEPKSINSLIQLSKIALIKVIQNVVMQAPKTLSHEDIDKIYSLLKSSSQVDYGTQQKYINKIKEKHMDNKN